MPNLEIGSGGNPQPGYIHMDLYVDSNTRPLVDVIGDARDIPFPDCEFDNILMFGVFEHFGIFECQEVMLEVVRVLKKGGTFKFDVPNVDWFMEHYLEIKTGLDPKRDKEWLLKGIFGHQNGPGQFHKWGWNETRMRKFLEKPNWNFSQVRMIGKKWRDPEENHLIWECRK